MSTAPIFWSNFEYYSGQFLKSGRDLLESQIVCTIHVRQGFFRVLNPSMHSKVHFRQLENTISSESVSLDFGQKRLTVRRLCPVLLVPWNSFHDCKTPLIFSALMVHEFISSSIQFCEELSVSPFLSYFMKYLFINLVL